MARLTPVRRLAHQSEEVAAPAGHSGAERGGWQGPYTPKARVGAPAQPPASMACGAGLISCPTSSRIRDGVCRPLWRRLCGLAQCVRVRAQRSLRSPRTATRRGRGRNRCRSGWGRRVARTSYRTGDNRFVPRQVDVRARGVRLRSSGSASALACPPLPCCATGCRVQLLPQKQY